MPSQRKNKPHNNERNKTMLAVQVSPRKKLFVSFCPDTEPNKGGYYCQVYADSDMEFELDNFTISKSELRGATDSLKLAYRIANGRVKAMF